MTETYQDIRVTVGHEFGSKEYHTKRVKFACRGLSVLAPAIRNSSLCCGVTRQLLMASRRVQLWSAVKFGSGKISAVGGSLIVWSFPVLCLCSATVMSIFLWTMLFGFLPKRSGRFASACCLSWHVWSRVWVLLKLHCGLAIAVRCSCSFEEAGSAPGVRGEDESWVLDKKVLTSCFPLTRTNFLGLVTSYLRLILRSCLTFFIG